MHALPPRNRMLASDAGWCLRVNRIGARSGVRRAFAIVSRLGDGVFWYVLMAALVMFDGYAGPLASLHLAATGAVADRKSVASGKRVSVRLAPSGPRILQKKKK